MLSNEHLLNVKVPEAPLNKTAPPSQDAFASNLTYVGFALFPVKEQFVKFAFVEALEFRTQYAPPPVVGSLALP